MLRKNKLFSVKSGTATTIDRVPQSHKKFDEAWVRDLIFRTPLLLPIDQVRNDAGAFLPIGIEVPLDKAGFADVLGLTTGGYPVVIETKLWRNPDSRRKVLAQTIDYVNEIAKRDYEWFDDQWQKQRRPDQPPSLYEAAAQFDDFDLDEAEFIDRVSASCAKGDVIGMIVGDGIHQRLAELIDNLGRESSHLRYTLAMVELQCFEMSSDHFAVLPTIVREVLPVERAYIRIEPAAELIDQLSIHSVSTPSDPDAQSARKPQSHDQFWSEFTKNIGKEDTGRIKAFVDAVRQSAGLVEDYKERSLMLKVSDPEENGKDASVFALTNEGTAFNSSIGIGRAEQWGIPNDRVKPIFDKYFQRLHEICDSFPVEGIKHRSTSQFVPIRKFIGRLDDISAAIKNVASALRAASTESEWD